jgi:hypothetical protein
MSSYINDDLRHLVASRSDYLCEYCLIAEEDTFYGCQVDHIISLKHGGATEPNNLAYACAFCNRHKGSDIASNIPGTVKLVRFYNPRTDKWADHFRLNGNIIEPLTDIGEATVRILGFNCNDRILEREALIGAGSYPTAEALARMR